MRTTTAVRLGAAFTASALALSLGAGTALAEGDTTDNQSAHLKSVSSTAGTAAKTPVGSSADSFAKASSKASADDVTTLAAVADIISFGQKSVVLDEPGTFAYEGTPNVTNPEGISQITTRLTVNGSNKGIRFLQSDGIVLDSSTTTPGKAKLGPSTIYYTDASPATADPTIGGYFYIRRYTKSTATYGFEIYRTGSKIKFKANYWKIFKPSTGTYVGMPSIKLQYRHSNGSYSTIKTISLNTYGSGSYTKTTNTKRRYRLLISTTDSIWGSKSTTSPLI